VNVAFYAAAGKRPARRNDGRPGNDASQFASSAADGQVWPYGDAGHTPMRMKGAGLMRGAAF